MRTFRRALAFSLVFVVDVRVKAETIALPNAQEVTQEPERCLLEASLCALKTAAGEKFKLRMGEAEVVLDESTAVIRQAEGELTLLSGTVWVRAKGEFSVFTAYGEVRAQRGEFWVRDEPRHEPKRTLIAAIDGVLTLLPRAAGRIEAMRLEPGEENWLGPVRADGVASSDVPTAIVPRAHFLRWARLYPGTRKQFDQEVREFHDLWSRALASIAAHHQSRADAHRARLAERDARAAQVKAQEDAHSLMLRTLFRKKNHLE